MNAFGFNITHFGRDNPKRMPSHLFFGACHMDYNTAKRADISKQHYTVCPRHWYVDATFICCECGKEFVFTADEQCFWYEDRKFFIQSLPKRCVKCRKADRTRLELKKRYDSLIAATLRKCPPEAKKEVIEIINELEFAEGKLSSTMKENRSILNKQLSKLT